MVSIIHRGQKINLRPWLEWLCVGRGWGTFLWSMILAVAAVMFHEHRQVGRTKLKQALTVYYDSEKTAAGLNALMGRG